LINKVETYKDLEVLLNEYLERMGEEVQWY
jgi:hypothetical protein